MLTCLSVFGLYPVFKLMQWQAREAAEKKIMQSIPDKDLQVFVNLSANSEIEWEEAEQEFHYRGGMYDVVRKEIKNGTSYYYCFNDSSEAIVFKDLEQDLSKELGKNHPLSGPVQKYMSKIFVLVYIPSGKWMLSVQPSEIQVKRQLFCLHPYRSAYPEVTVPPPKATLI